MASSRGEKHFKAAGNNVSRRPYKNVIMVWHYQEGSEMAGLGIPHIVSCRPARAARALRKFRTDNPNLKVTLEKQPVHA